MEYTLENFGLTKSPLDAWRGTGRHSNRASNYIEPLQTSKHAQTIKIASPIAKRPKSPETITLFITKPIDASGNGK